MRTTSVVRVVKGWPFKLNVATGFKLNLVFAGSILKLHGVIGKDGFKVFHGGEVNRVDVYSFRFWGFKHETVVVETLANAGPEELELPDKMALPTSTLNHNIITNVPAPSFRVRQNVPRMKLASRVIPKLNRGFSLRWTSPKTNNLQIDLNNQLTIKQLPNVSTRPTQ